MQQVDKEAHLAGFGQASTTTGTYYLYVHIYKALHSIIPMPISALNINQHRKASLSVFFNYVFTIRMVSWVVT
jgi:hypothetical protein